jgi:hypothetical protein
MPRDAAVTHLLATCNDRASPLACAFTSNALAPCGRGHFKTLEPEAAMSEQIDQLVADLDAYEPTEDSVADEEQLQILVDIWEGLPERGEALPAFLRLFERYPEYNGLGEPGPLVHAVEQVPGYEDEVIASLGRVPNYYGVWMLGRILDSDTTPEQRARVLALLHKLAGGDDVPDSIRALARETYEFRE